MPTSALRDLHYVLMERHNRRTEQIKFIWDNKLCSDEPGRMSAHETLAAYMYHLIPWEGKAKARTSEESRNELAKEYSKYINKK